MKKICFAAATLLAASSALAAPITSFNNLDFDAGVSNIGGFDAPNDVPGWTNNTPVVDSGVEGPGAWWGPYDNYAAFMASGDSAYTMSTHTIQAGEVFNISFHAMQWQWTGAGQWTASLFYDTPSNIIGSYTQGGLPDNGTWTAFADPVGIAATPASVGGTLGILLQSTGTGIAQIDEITVDVAIPEPVSSVMVGVCGAALVLARRRSAR
jgi:hypothetical protein